MKKQYLPLFGGLRIIGAIMQCIIADFKIIAVFKRQSGFGFGGKSNACQGKNKNQREKNGECFFHISKSFHLFLSQADGIHIMQLRLLRIIGYLLRIFS